jgi:abequosyltransferase
MIEVSKLAIAIPTYNRAEMLESNLLQIMEELIRFNISVYISDDSTNNETENLIKKLKEKHDLFHYRKNRIRLGHDLNCIHTISMSKEEYVWYLGDSMIIKNGALEKVLDIINKEDYDFISCNAEGRDLDIETGVFTDKIKILEELCWHLTLTGATIYNKERLFDLSNFDVSKFKNFPQTAILFEQFARKKASLLWINEKLIANNPNKSSYWVSKVFEVFIYDLKSFVYGMSSIYPIKSKDYAILQHSVKTGIFNYGNFVKYRISGFYNYSVFNSHKKDIAMYTNSNLVVLLAIAVVPNRILKIVFNLFKK